MRCLEQSQLEFDRDPIVLPTTTQAPGESLRLDIWRATQFADGGFRWEFSLATAGRYRVILLSKQTFSGNAPQWNGAGLKGRLLTAGSEQPFVIVDDGHEPYPIIHYWKLVRSNIGNLVAESTGEQWLEIRDLPVLDSKWGDGFLNVVGVRLEFEQGGTEVHA